MSFVSRPQANGEGRCKVRATDATSLVYSLSCLFGVDRSLLPRSVACGWHVPLHSGSVWLPYLLPMIITPTITILLYCRDSVGASAQDQGKGPRTPSSGAVPKAPVSETIPATQQIGLSHFLASLNAGSALFTGHWIILAISEIY